MGAQECIVEGGSNQPMKTNAGALLNAIARVRAWLSDRGKELFLASMQCLVGGGLVITIVVYSWQAGSFPPKQPSGINDILIAASILTWSVVALIASLGIMFRARWTWKLQIAVAAVPLLLQAYLLFQIKWNNLVSLEDWLRVMRAAALTVGLLYLVVYAFRKAFTKDEDISPEVHSASNESATNNIP